VVENGITGEIMEKEIIICENAEELSRRAAEFIKELADKYIARQNYFSLALCGGSTPRLLFQTLAAPPFKHGIAWNKVHFFWGDERFVLPSHPESNVRLARDLLLSQVRVPEENIHLPPEVLGSPDEAAAEYEAILKKYFQDGEELFDLNIMGLGADGHTASLFPRGKALNEKNSWVTASMAPEDAIIRDRITLTLSAINRSKNIIFLVSGAEKKEILQKILNDPRTAKKIYPAAQVRALDKLVWFVSKETL
jgi:6-phosphogluconolactonase